ncbi:MAG: hypothetical protein NC548_29800 [Lachnospiraceae bacterium]|nr:hypothetical protein [Lachnospiraceae bacterium]
MSLVSSILESFDTNSSFGGYNIVSEGGAAMDFSVTDGAVMEMMRTISAADRVVQSADVMASMKYILEGTDVTVVMENVVSDAITKIKNGFIKLKNTIVAWFNKAVKFFQSLFKSGKEFVTAYGGELKKKSTSGFKYYGYEWNKGKGDSVVDKIFSATDREINSMISDLGKAADSNADNLQYSKTNDGESDYGDTVIGGMSIGASNISEMKEEIVKAYRGGTTDKTTEAELTSSKVSDYLSYIETGKDVISKIKKTESDFEKRLSSIISTLDKIAGKEDSSGDKQKNASAVSRCLTTLLTIKKSASESQVASYRDMLKAETAILKKFLHWGGKKDTTEATLYDMEDMEMLEATYPVLESDDIMEYNLECNSNDDDDMTLEESTDSSSLFNQISAMLGV